MNILLRFAQQDKRFIVASGRAKSSPCKLRKMPPLRMTPRPLGSAEILSRAVSIQPSRRESPAFATQWLQTDPPKKSGKFQIPFVHREASGIPKMGPIVGRLPGRRAFSCIFLTQNNLLILIFLHLLSLSLVLSVHRAMASPTKEDDGLTSVAKLMQARKRVLGSMVQPKLYF